MLVFEKYLICFICLDLLWNILWKQKSYSLRSLVFHGFSTNHPHKPAGIPFSSDHLKSALKYIFSLSHQIHLPRKPIYQLIYVFVSPFTNKSLKKKTIQTNNQDNGFVSKILGSKVRLRLREFIEITTLANHFDCLKDKNWVDPSMDGYL